MVVDQNYLTAMGIQIWKARLPLPGAKPASNYQIFQLAENGRVVGTLLLDNKYLPGFEAQVESLLDNMLTAIGLQRGKFAGQVQEKRFLIMGLELANRFVKGDNISVVATFHPLDLLQQPGYKRQAWSDLQLLAKQWQLIKTFR